MTEFSDRTHMAQVNFDKKDYLYKRVIMAFYIYAAVLLTIGTVYSVATNYQIARNQKINTQASKERQVNTQKFILCIGTELSIPQGERPSDPSQACKQ